MKKNILLIIFLVSSSNIMIAQQLVNPTQLRWVYDINPATIGINENISLTKRQVFSGIQGAPSLQFLSINKLVDNTKGVGLNVYDYSEGFIQTRGIKTGYMYRAHFSENTYCAFGFSVDLFQRMYNKEMYNLKDPKDPAFIDQRQEQIAIDFDAGLSFNTPIFYFDFAIHQVPGRSVALLNDNIQSRRLRHYYANTGFKLDVSDDIRLEPSIFFKTIEQLVYHLDGGLRMIVEDKFWIGAYYRTTNAIPILAGFKLDRYSFGFAYDFGFQDIYDYTSGSWEFQFSYDLNKTKPKHSPVSN